MEKKLQNIAKQDGKHYDEQGLDKGNKTEMEKTALEEAAIFGRRESLKRTPPGVKRFRSSSAPGRNSPETETPTGYERQASTEDDDVLTSPTFGLTTPNKEHTRAKPPREQERPRPDKTMEIGAVGCQILPALQKTITQEQMAEVTTGNERETTPRPRANTFPMEGTQDTGEKPGKRLREDEGDQLQELRKRFDRLVKTVNELVEITEASSKTKTEIKNSVRKLKRHTSDVCKEWQTVDTGGGRAKRDAEVKEMRSVSVQVDLADINKELEEKKRRTLNKIQAAIEGNDTFDKLSEILDEKWPQDIYKITETEGVTEKIGHHGDYAILFDPSKVENNKLTFDKLSEILDEKWPQDIYKITETEGVTEKIGHHGDYAILFDPSKVENNKLIEKLMLKYDGLAEVIAANQGLPDFLIQTSKVRTRTNAYEERSSAVHLLPLEIDMAGVNDMRVVYDNLMHLKENIHLNAYEERSSAVHLLPLEIDMAGVNDMRVVYLEIDMAGVNDMRVVYDNLMHLKENIAMHPAVSINLITCEGLKFSYVRKICEFVFAKVKIKIKMIAQGQRSEPLKRKKKEESVVMVKAEGKSFVDIVKTLKVWRSTWRVLMI
ncbi:hypothetical protein QE152_g34172 [Popillia japonica]|uniref:Uncharacterized protein n=1 Tax=Popillia japonica TaxID=7064 RepID=A0AAW1IUC5_POPJA